MFDRLSVLSGPVFSGLVFLVGTAAAAASTAAAVPSLHVAAG